LPLHEIWSGGIPVPLKEAVGKVFYVWFDGSIGYISATMDWATLKKGKARCLERYWYDPDTKLVPFYSDNSLDASRHDNHFTSFK